MEFHLQSILSSQYRFVLNLCITIKIIFYLYFVSKLGLKVVKKRDEYNFADTIESLVLVARARLAAIQNNRQNTASFG